jgi:MoaA/NifB/PqqE/SkfB family radical SAM enzyme
MNEENKKTYHPLDPDIVEGYNSIRDQRSPYLCKAPFTSIFFAPAGKILACWYNKREELGTYPDNSIHEIWNGPRLAQLRDHIRHNDLSFGCEFCQANLSDRNYHKVDAYRYDYLPDHPGGYPGSFDFQISNTCNLECIMCNGELSSGVRQHREQQSLYPNPYDSNFVKQLEEYIPHLQDAAFSGGEPFLIELYYQIWDAMLKLNPGIRISLTTNGTILNERVKSYLEKLKFNIAVSLDSIDPATYARIRRRGDLEKTLEHFAWFRDYARSKGTSISIKTCPMRQNIMEMDRIVDFANENQVAVFFNTVVYPPACSLWNTGSSALRRYYKHLDKALKKYKGASFLGNVERLEGLSRQIRLWHKEAEEREKMYRKLPLREGAYVDLIMQRIRPFIEEAAYLDAAAKEQKADAYRSFLTQTFALLQDEKTRRGSAEYFMGLATARLLGEIEFRTPEKMADRFNYLAQEFQEEDVS